MSAVEWERTSWSNQYKLSKPDPPSKRSLAREYGVTEGAVRKVWKQKDEIEQCSMSMSVETRSQSFLQSKGHFPEVENQLYNWIDAMRRANLPVSPSLALTKAKQIANELLISKDDFKALYKWLMNFRLQRFACNFATWWGWWSQQKWSSLAGSVRWIV